MKHLFAGLILVALGAFVACTPDGGEPTASSTATPSATSTVPPATTATPTVTLTATPTPSATPTATPDVVATEWTVGEPVPLPDGVTLVLGTGCWQCGGQYSTYETFDEGGRTVLHRPEGEVNVAAYLGDPSHLHIANCRPECNGYEGQHEGTTTTLHESSTRGETWRSLGEIAPVRRILGARPSGDLLVESVEGDLTWSPSGDPVEPPAAAVEDTPPLMLDGEPLWNTADETLVDGNGAVLVDFAGIGYPGADVFHLDAHSDGRLLLWWALGEARGLAVLDADGRTLIVRDDQYYPWNAEGVWLDDERFIVSVQYSREEVEEFGVPPELNLFGSRTPTIVDLSTGTLHPIEDFFAEGAPWGRNYIVAVWQE